MSKERLIELKSKLESKYVSYDGSDASGVITQYELEQKQNIQGAITNLENYFESLITKLELNGKLFDELMISAVYKLFYKYEDIDEVLNTTANVNPLKDLSVKHYELWRKEINKADISTAYKNDIQKFIKIVLNWGSKMYDFDFRSFYNKITKFINHNELKKEMDFYTLEEFKQFISCENDLKFKCLYETLYYCGLRRGEARALTWNDINFEEKQLRVNKNIVQIGNDN